MMNSLISLLERIVVIIIVFTPLNTFKSKFEISITLLLGGICYILIEIKEKLEIK